LLELALVEVYRPDLGRTGDPRSLDHRQPDRATADHGDARARLYLRRLEDGHDAGGDCAADEAPLLDGQLARDADGRDGRDHGVPRERAGGKDRRGVGAAPAMQPAAGRGRALALPGPALPTRHTLAARGFPAEDDAVARSEVHSGPRGHDRA